MEVMGQQPLVSVVDDDESVRESLPDPLQQGGFAAQAFSYVRSLIAISLSWRSAVDPGTVHRFPYSVNT
jgi:FixJ family two-component response regulator